MNTPGEETGGGRIASTFIVSLVRPSWRKEDPAF